MKLSRKIAICVLTAVVILSSMVLPSFAWSIEGDPPTVTKDSYFTTRFESNLEPETGETLEVFPQFADSTGTFTAVPLTNGLTKTGVSVYFYDDFGGVVSYRIRCAINVASNFRISTTRKGYNYYLYLNVYYSGSQWRVSAFLETDNLDLLDDNLRCRIEVGPSELQLQNAYDEYLEEAAGQQETIQQLENEIATLESTLQGLQNNNVLDGVFSGIGDGFSSMMTPLLSLSVGGVSLGNVIGVLLIIGAILLFILLINKLRGA